MIFPLKWLTAKATLVYLDDTMERRALVTVTVSAFGELKEVLSGLGNILRA
jgi:hypothetical protein